MLRKSGDVLVGLAVLGLALLWFGPFVGGSGPTPIGGVMIAVGATLLVWCLPLALLVGAILLVRRLLGWNGRRAGGRVPAPSATGWRLDLDGAPHEVWAWASATTWSGIRALVDGQYQTAVAPASRTPRAVGAALTMPGHELRVGTAIDSHLPLEAVNGQPGPMPLRFDLFVDGKLVPPWAYADGDGGTIPAAPVAAASPPAQHDAFGRPAAPTEPVIRTSDGRSLHGQPPHR